MAEGNGDGPSASQENDKEYITFKAVWKKNNYDITFPVDDKIAKLKAHIQTLTGIPPAMMKLTYKGILKDDLTLKEAKVTAGIKMMIIGSTLNDVIAVQAPDPSEMKQSQVEETDTVRESLSESKEHKRIIEKGVPDDVHPGIKHCKEPLPPTPLSGMLNKYGAKVRLHFKLEMDQLWIATKERTDKVPLGSIRNVLSEPIKGHEEYHIMALQLGPTENSRYWLYWVPCQYVEAIKDAILGKWQYF